MNPNDVQAVWRALVALRTAIAEGEEEYMKVFKRTRSETRHLYAVLERLLPREVV